jgi:PTH1 family peptidyl-tRNA hydrolase
MKLVVGLGNVGPQYAHTRHNIGFLVVDEIARQLGGTWKPDPKISSEVLETSFDNDKIVLAKPQTMMNLSGKAVQQLLAKYRSDGARPSTMWVIHDDIDLDVGDIRSKFDGGSGGQKGVESIIETVGPKFRRVRIGIGRNDRASEPSEVYVLKRMPEVAVVNTLQQFSTLDLIRRYLDSREQD